MQCAGGSIARGRGGVNATWRSGLGGPAAAQHKQRWGVRLPARHGSLLACRAEPEGSGEGAAVTDEAKRAAAKAAVDMFVKPGDAVGLGTGELVGLAAEYLAERAAAGALSGVVAVPSCALAASEAAFAGLKMAKLGDPAVAAAGGVAVLLEQADQIDLDGNAFLKGALAAPVQPDLPAAAALVGAAAKVVVLAERGAVVSGRLRAGLPVAIQADGWEEPAEALDDIFLGDAELWRRPAQGTSNPRGGDNPYVSQDGSHTIVDVRFYEGLKLFGEDAPYEAIAAEVSGVDGVLAHGLFVGRAAAAVVAGADADGGSGAVVTPLEVTKQQQEAAAAPGGG